MRAGALARRSAVVGAFVGAFVAAPTITRADVWSLDATLAPPQGATFRGIAGAGSTLVLVGSTPEAQQVFAFRRVDGLWGEAEVLPTGSGGNPLDPECVSDDAVISLSEFDDSYAIRILTSSWLGDGWSAPQVVAGTASADVNELGEALAIRGDRLAITVSHTDQATPECATTWRVLAFRRSGDQWELDGSAVPPNACATSTGFLGLAVDGDRIVQLVRRESQHVAHIFRGDAGTWEHESALTTPGAGYDRVAIAGSRLVLGAADAEAGAGVLDIFTLGDAGWVLEERLKGTGEGPIAIDGEVIAAAKGPDMIRVFARGEGWIDEVHLNHRLAYAHAFALQGETLAVLDLGEGESGGARVLVYQRGPAPTCEGGACDEDDEGCGCRAGGAEGWLGALLLSAWIGGRRRRRARVATET